MNCYRCGFDFSGSKCLVCGKLAPSENDPVGRDSSELRIAVVVPDREPVTEMMVTDLKEKTDHYQLESDNRNREHIFVYTPRQTQALFELLEKTETIERRKILFNGRVRPYDAELWLPLLWFTTS